MAGAVEHGKRVRSPRQLKHNVVLHCSSIIFKPSPPQKPKEHHLCLWPPNSVRLLSLSLLWLSQMLHLLLLVELVDFVRHFMVSFVWLVVLFPFLQHFLQQLCGCSFKHICSSAKPDRDKQFFTQTECVNTSLHDYNSIQCSCTKFQRQHNDLPALGICATALIHVNSKSCGCNNCRLLVGPKP